MNIFQMHEEMAKRNNASSMLIKAMAQLGKPFNDATATALMTLDSLHAPITDTCKMWNTYVDHRAWPTTHRVPGFGSAWYKGTPDPVVEEFLEGLSPGTDELVLALTTHVQEVTGHELYPNAALATAIAARIRGYTPATAISMVIEGRLPIWREIYAENLIERGF